MSRVDAVRFAASVFSREAIRASRRWQTWVQRAAFAAVLLAWVVSAMAATVDPTLDPAIGGTIGWQLFTQYTYAQITLVVLFTPLIVGQGIIEERDESTLGLLALTRLSPRQILWGKVGSRLLVLGSWVLGSAPVLAACTTFGGVSPLQVVTAVVNTLLLLLVLGLLGGLVALVVDGTLAVAIVVGGWCLTSLIIVPVLFVFAVGPTTTGSSMPVELGWLSPLMAPGIGGATGLLPVLAMLPILSVATRWAEPLFAAAIADPDARDVPLRLREARSPEARDVGLRARGAGWAGLAVLLVAPFVFAELWLPTGVVPSILSPTARDIAYGVWTVALLASGTSLLVLVLLRAAELRRRFGVTGLGALRKVPLDPLRLFRGRVWGHPVAWREVLTNAYGGSSLLARWGFLLWLGATTLFLAPLVSLDELSSILVMSGFFAGFGLSLFLAAETIATERRQRTLELLSISTIRSLSMVGGKVAAVAVLAGPYVAVATVVQLVDFMLRNVWVPMDDTYIQAERVYCAGWTIAWGNRFVRVGITAAWIAAAWATGVTASMLGAMWVRHPRQAWIVNLALVAAVLGGTSVVESFLPWGASRIVQSVVYPFSSQWGDPWCGTSRWLFVSTLVYALAACGLFVACTASIRLVVRRDAR